MRFSSFTASYHALVGCSDQREPHRSSHFPAESYDTQPTSHLGTLIFCMRISALMYWCSSAEIAPRSTQDFSPPRHKGTKKKFSVQFLFTSLRFLSVLVPWCSVSRNRSPRRAMIHQGDEDAPGLAPREPSCPWCPSWIRSLECPQSWRVCVELAVNAYAQTLFFGWRSPRGEW